MPKVGKKFQKQLDAIPPEVAKYLSECVDRSALAVIVRCTPRTISRWVEKHDLPSVRIAGGRFFHYPTVLDWLLSEESPTLCKSNDWDALKF